MTLDSWLPTVYHILVDNMKRGLKTILFMQAAQETRLLAFLLGASPELAPVFEIHSRLSQSQRIKQLNNFKSQKGGSILCSSDVGARGWDIEGVDMVVQLGIPSDNDTYVHRVGRTARAGTSGIAICLAFDWEMRHFLSRFPRAKTIQTDPIRVTNEDVQAVDRMLRTARSRGDAFLQVSKQGYSAFLGYQNSMRSKHKMSPADCVQLINQWIHKITGNPEPPALEAKTIGKMGLKGVPGLRRL